jgi:hypothetical protein
LQDFLPKAQTTDSAKTDAKLKISAYAELFYTYDFNEPSGKTARTFCTATTGTMKLILI